MIYFPEICFFDRVFFYWSIFSLKFDQFDQFLQMTQMSVVYAMLLLVTSTTSFLELFKLVKPVPKFLSWEKNVLKVFSLYLLSTEITCHKLSHFQCVGWNQSFLFFGWDQFHT